MAIFYGHIKGFSDDEGNKKWIKIEFKDNDSPLIYLADTKANLEDTSNRLDLGNIATTKRSNDFSQKEQQFGNIMVDKISSNSDNLVINSNVSILWNYNLAGYDNRDEKNVWLLTSDFFQMTGNLEIGPNVFNKDTPSSTFSVNSSNGNVKTGTITAIGNISSSQITTGSISSSGDISSGGQITGSSFNATSDRRAKTNIYTYNQSVLDLLCNWHLYTFNYNNNSSERQIGIIAQEHLDDDKNLLFDIVENKNASGEGNDYMHVKESKLVYLAIKAIQELAEENRKLKQEVEEIKKGLL